MIPTPELVCLQLVGFVEPNAYGEGYQDVSLMDFVSSIDNDSAAVSFGVI